ATVAGGGLAQAGEEYAVMYLTNTMVALNTAPAAPDVSGPGGNEYENVIASHSLIGDGTGSDQENTGGNLVGNVEPYTAAIDPRIGALATNGGPTRTHALQTGSPAIDAASSDLCPATDQRDVSRPQGAGCDIGSFERE
ncbi:MAG TPA: choice-of-anchor Q domain-containing protein, partial [Gemmatimonadales bacterium]